MESALDSPRSQRTRPNNLLREWREPYRVPLSPLAFYALTMLELAGRGQGFRGYTYIPRLTGFFNLFPHGFSAPVRPAKGMAALARPA